MPGEWSIYVSTLYKQKTSVDVIARLAMHDATIAHHRKPSPQTAQALTMTQIKMSRSSLVCSNPVCRRIGHTIDRCLNLVEKWRVNTPIGGRRRVTLPVDGSPTLRTTPKPGQQTPTANITLVPTGPVTGMSSDNFYAFMTLLSRSQGTHITMYADSAASDHCFVNIDNFSTYIPFTRKSGTTATADGIFNIQGTGTVRKQMVFNRRVINIAFENALHTPDLSQNLMSIGHLDKAGCYSIFGSGGVIFINKDNALFMHGRGVGTMYEMDIVPATVPITAKLDIANPRNIDQVLMAKNTVTTYATRSHTKATDINTWHQRLGHIGYQAIEQMYQGKVVDGLDITTLTPKPGACKDCIMGKHTHCAFYTNDHQEVDVGERVYIDLWGPLCVESVGGKSYMMPFVDGFSGHIEGYFLGDKQGKTTLQALKHYVALAERQTGRKVLHVCTDEGSEFCNRLWRDFLMKCGMVHETTAAYSSESNGVVECTH